MGSQLSRATSSSSARHPPRPPPSPSSVPPLRTTSSDPGSSNPSRHGPSAADLSSYEAACRADPDLRSFDSSLHLRTSRAINSIAVGLDVRSLSLNSLTEVTEILLEMNQEALKLILQSKREIWNNKELSDLVDDYFDNSLLTLDFCTSLDACLKRASHIETTLNLALQRFQDEHYNNDTAVKDYSRTLEELSGFKQAGDPFQEEFFRFFNSVYSKQKVMLERLQARKSKLDRKLRRLKAWKKVCNVIFVVAFASVLICSVVAAAVSAPPVVTALAAAAAMPLGSMGRWLNSIWKRWERDIEGQREIVSAMQIGSYIVIKDLDEIRVLVERLQIEIEGLLASADFATREGEEAVVIAVEEIKRKVEGFVKTLNDLSKHTNKCAQEMRMARTLILRRIMNHPSGSGQDIGMFS